MPMMTSRDGSTGSPSGSSGSVSGIPTATYLDTKTHYKPFYVFKGVPFHKDENGDVKIVDMDSVRFKDEYDGDEFQFKVAASHKLLSQLTLSYLSKMNIMELAKILPEELLKEMFSSVFRGRLYEYSDVTFGFPDEIIYPSEFLPYIEENDLINLRETLVKKLRK